MIAQDGGHPSVCSSSLTKKKKEEEKKKSKQKIDKIHFTLRMFVSSSERDLTVVRFYSPDKLLELARTLQLQCDVILVDSLFVCLFFYLPCKSLAILANALTIR